MRRKKEEFRRKKSRSKKCCVHIQPLPCAATLSCFAFHATNVKYTVASRLCIARYALHILVVHQGTARANIRKFTVTSYNTSSVWQGAKEEDW